MVEVSWLGISLLAGVITSGNLLAAVRSWQVYRRNGETHRIVALGGVWLNALLLASTFGCIVIVVPALLREGDTPLSPFVLAAMLIPAGLAGASTVGRRTRLRVERLLG